MLRSNSIDSSENLSLTEFNSSTVSNSFDNSVVVSSNNILNTATSISTDSNINTIHVNKSILGSNYGHANVISYHNDSVQDFTSKIIEYLFNSITYNKINNNINNTSISGRIHERDINKYYKVINSNEHEDQYPVVTKNIVEQNIEGLFNLVANNFSDYLINNTVGNFTSQTSSTTTTTASSSSLPYLSANIGNSSINSSFNVLNKDVQIDSQEEQTEFVFDRTDVRVIFITLYTLVFCCCFCGNLLVILVVVLSRRLRSITNFFLANLAVADLCVGVFCVMQNLSIYLIDSWVFGEFLCRMYQFVHSLSYTASIFILVVICMERYFAIIHPITCKQILTTSRLRLVILSVWVTSAIYSTPKFLFSTTITNLHTDDGVEEKICVLDRKKFNSKLLDLINFGLLYVTPLLVMTILYTRIAVTLWKSSRGLEHHIGLQNTTNGSPTYSSNNLYRKQSSKYEKKAIGGVAESQLNGNMQVSVDQSEKFLVTTWKKSSFHQRHGTQVTQISHSSNTVLRARRGVIRMLIIVVLTFAICNLPYHARKMWQNWSNSYRGDSNFIALFTPLTFLVSYFNSGINPLLYAFLSRNFRKGMRELLFCSFKKGKSKASMHQRVTIHNHSLPTDSTHVGNQL